MLSRLDIESPSVDKRSAGRRTRLQRLGSSAVEFSYPYRAENGFDGLLGLVVTAGGEDWVTAELPVRDALKQPAGLVHGGVYASIAETLASLATAAGVMPGGETAQGLSNQTSFLRPILDGTIHARARRR